jgi:hypothetical protein
MNNYLTKYCISLDSCISIWQLHIHLKAVYLLTAVYQPDSYIYNIPDSCSCQRPASPPWEGAGMSQAPPGTSQSWKRFCWRRLLKRLYIIFILVCQAHTVQSKRNAHRLLNLAFRIGLFRFFKKSGFCRLTFILLCTQRKISCILTHTQLHTHPNTIHHPKMFMP